LQLANRSQRLEVNGTVRFRGPDVVIAQLQNFDLKAVRASRHADGVLLPNIRTVNNLILSPVPFLPFFEL